ncbi:Zinc finger protein [Fasciola gigantica]|uniref:Zinc finger protein n=1 Tax=Fasciola gigantica TaxID=46835 RepID=A0A504Y7B9_FASGI|nr:Zinc finger protein [Fasciola gigantica]
MITATPNHDRRSLGSMRNLLSILNGELADGKTTLAAASCDIERAASYCGDNYLNCQKEGKLDNTMAFATQSLGTVAYQISRLASQFLEAVDMQSVMLGDISDRIEKLRMVCNAHQEKVSRKAIGSCTNPKVPIIFQHDGPHPEQPLKYIRRPIDYSLLDSVGHGIRIQEPVLNQYGVPVLHSNTVQRRSSASASACGQGPFVRQHSTVSCRTSGTKSSIEYAAPIHASNTMRYQSGTLGRTAGIYRTAVVPPQHLLGADQFHPHSSGGGSSPAAGSLSSSNYAPGGASVAASLASADVANAAVVLGQSSRSSGSSSLGSSAPHATASASQMIQQAHAQNQQQSAYGQPFQSSHIPAVQGSQPKVVYTISDPNTAAAMHLRQQQYQATQGLQSSPMTGQHHVQTQGYQIAHAQAPDFAIAQQQQYAQQKQLQQHQASMHAMQSTGIPHNLIPMEPPSTISPHVAGHSQHNHEPVDQNPAPVSPTSVASSEVVQVPPPEAYAGPAPSTPHHAYLTAEVSPLAFGDACGSEAPVGLIARRPEDPVWAPDYYMEKVITMYEYVRDKDDELTFTENQIIYVIKKNDDGWWEGVMNGITGLFPGNYVELYG